MAGNIQNVLSLLNFHWGLRWGSNTPPPLLSSPGLPTNNWEFYNCSNITLLIIIKGGRRSTLFCTQDVYFDCEAISIWNCHCVYPQITHLPSLMSIHLYFLSEIFPVWMRLIDYIVQLQYFHLNYLLFLAATSHYSSRIYH